MLKLEEVVLAHEPDIAWLIALWLAIHGGDSAHEVIEVDETSALLAAALSSHLAATHSLGAVTVDRLRQTLGDAGIVLQGSEDEERRCEPVEAQRRRVCTLLPGGRTYCFLVPTVKGPLVGEPGR